MRWIQEHFDVCLNTMNARSFLYLCIIYFFNYFFPFRNICFIICYKPSVPSSIRKFPYSFHLSTVDQTEDVVEDEVASLAVGLELEGLRVIHGLLLLIDLRYRDSNSRLANLAPSVRI